MNIEKLIYGGFGLGRNKNGKPVFVYKSVPKDDVEVETIEQKKSFEKAIIKKLVSPSEDRIEPTCPHFFECGGCEHQNISYQKQLYWKNEIFAETLRRAKIELIPDEIVAGNNEPFFYRNVIRFFMETDKNNKIFFSMHHYLYDQGNVEIKKCFLQSETSNTTLATLKDIINEKVEQKSSFWQLRIREGKFTGEFMIEIMTDNNDLPGRDIILSELKKIPSIKSIYHTYSYDRDLNDLTRNLIYGSPVIFEKIGNFSFQISPESFFQTNSLGIKTLYDTIKSLAEIKVSDTVLDLYCGTGTIGIYLSTLAKNILGVDNVKEAIKDARDNAKINKVYNSEFISDDAEKFLSKNKSKFDVIIVDPPRTGLNKNIIESICKSLPKKVVYVSCNPSTFARDIKHFEEFGWQLKKVQPIDMFPQTHHIECVGLIERI